MALPVTVIDLSTRMVAGWSLSERMTADIAASALASAKSRGYAACFSQENFLGTHGLFVSSLTAQAKAPFLFLPNFPTCPS